MSQNQLYGFDLSGGPNNQNWEAFRFLAEFHLGHRPTTEPGQVLAAFKLLAPDVQDLVAMVLIRRARGFAPYDDATNTTIFPLYNCLQAILPAATDRFITTLAARLRERMWVAEVERRTQYAPSSHVTALLMAATMYQEKGGVICGETRYHKTAPLAPAADACVTATAAA